jgi:RND family efflux transporter MFP subunit
MSFDQNALDSLRIERETEPTERTGSPIYKWLIATVLLIAVIAGAVAFFHTGALEVETVTATPAANSGSGGAAVLNASGYVVARRQATVSAKTTGKIAEVHVEEGMTVKEGQLLARLDNTTIRPLYNLAQRQLESARKNLNEIQVRLEEAERTLHRNEQLRANHLVSESQVDQAQSDVAAQRAHLEALQAEVRVSEGNLKVREQDLEDLMVTAPFDGVIVSKDAQPGEIVSPMSAGGGFTRTGIATIVDMDSREIEVDVNEAFINRVRQNQRTEAVLDAYPDWVIPSHVVSVVPTADRQKATVRVRIGFDELDPRILPQMGVKVTFLEDREGAQQAASARPGVRIPSSAVTDDSGTKYVWRVNGDKAERVAVSTGNERDGQVEVVAGVNPGDIVVARPVDGLKEGSKIKPKS